MGLGMFVTAGSTGISWSNFLLLRGDRGFRSLVAIHRHCAADEHKTTPCMGAAINDDVCKWMTMRSAVPL
jgi:hypothetical protein